MIGKLLERLFVEVRADMSDLSKDLAQGVSQTRAATNAMALSWGQVSSQVQMLTTKLDRGTITQGKYTSEMNKLTSAMKTVAGSYREAQKEVWGFAKAARTAATTPTPLPVKNVQAFTRSMGQARMQVMNLGYQINDIGMTLATGMNPMTVLIQQGSQIAQIYAGQGGITAMFKDLSNILLMLGKRLWPIAAIAGTIKAMQSEINAAGATTVTFGDTALAVFQTLWGYVSGYVLPVFEGIGEIGSQAWEVVKDAVKDAGNFMINAMRATVVSIGAGLEAIPPMFQIAWNAAKSEVLWAMSDIVGTVGKGLGAIAQEFNDTFSTSLNTDFSGLFELSAHLNEMGNDAAVAGSMASDALDQINKSTADAVQGIMSSDPLGGFFEDVKSNAIANAANRIAKEVDEIGNSAGRAATKTKEMVDELQNGLETAADNFSSIFGNAFEQIADTGRISFSSLVQDINRMLLKSVGETVASTMSNLIQTSITSSGGGLGGTLSNWFTWAFGGGSGLSKRARGGVEMPWKNFIAGEEGAELISQDGPAGARRVKTAGQTRAMMNGMGQSRPVQVNMYVTTPDVNSFGKSQSQIASKLSGYIGRGQRNQ